MQRGKLQCLKLLHFHFGSQVSDIAVIKEAMREGSHIYAELALLGAPMVRHPFTLTPTLTVTHAHSHSRFHFGSQISGIGTFMKDAMRKGSHIYAELARLGASMVCHSVTITSGIPSIHQSLFITSRPGCPLLNDG